MLPAHAATIFTEDVTIDDPDDYFSVETKEDAAANVVGGWLKAIDDSVVRRFVQEYSYQPDAGQWGAEWVMGI